MWWKGMLTGRGDFLEHVVDGLRSWTGFVVVSWMVGDTERGIREANVTYIVESRTLSRFFAVERLQ